MKPEDRKKTRISLIEDICDYVRGISLPERAMLNTLARYANPDGTNVFPSQGLLMEILEIKEREVRNLLTSLKNKGFVIPDGKHGYCKKYRLNIPCGVIGGAMPLIQSEELSKDEWEDQFLTDEELAAQGIRTGEDLGGNLEKEKDDKEATLPAVRVPDRTMALVPTTPPPIAGRLPVVVDSLSLSPSAATEKLGRDIGVLKESLNLVTRGIMTYDQFMRGGRRKGFSDETLEWLLRGGNSSESSQLSEPSITTFPLEDIVYQP